jgi:MFS family permease
LFFTEGKSLSNLDIIGRVKARSKRVFYGWWVVVAGASINALGVGSFFYGFSTFFNPMVAEFGWSRTVMSGAFSLSRLEGGIWSPVTGWLIDKYGARIILLIGVTMAGAGFIALYWVNSPLSLYLIFGLFLSLGFNMGFMRANTAAVTKWFIKKRSRALSFLTVGNGIGGAILVPTIAWLIIQFEWRWAAVIIGLSIWVICIPLSFLIRSTPEEMGLVPDGQSGKQANSPAEAGYGVTEASASSTFTEEVDFTVREALRTRTFWVYVGSMMLRACILSSLVIHQIPHLTDIGIPYQAASTVLGLMVLMSIPGRFLFGWLGDLFSKRMLLFLLCLLQGVGILIFIQATNLGLLYLFVAVYGLGYGGAIPLTLALQGDLFGRRHFASISGMMMPITMIGTITAPLLAGYLYDTTQSYSLIFYIFTAMISLSGIFFLLIPRPSPPQRLPREVSL